MVKLEILNGRKAIFVLIFGLKFSKSVAVITPIVSSDYCSVFDQFFPILPLDLQLVFHHVLKPGLSVTCCV